MKNEIKKNLTKYTNALKHEWVYYVTYLNIIHKILKYKKYLLSKIVCDKN